MAQVLDRPTQTPETADKQISGVGKLAEKDLRFQRRLVLIVTVVPFVGFAIALWSLWGGALSGTDFGIMLGTYLFAGLGITVGFHRLFTHRSFAATRPVRALLAVAGSFAIQGPLLKWVADHRRHHAFADQEGDPHSPHLDEGPGLKGVLKGLWHAHMGWLFSDEKTSIRRWAPDLLKDETLRRIDRFFFLWVFLSFFLPPAIGFALTGTLRGAASAFLWGSLVRIFLLHHVTWSVNSICHFYGKRPFETTDHSTNNWLLALISFGESWHNNHHAFPTSATHGILRGQIDPGAGFIKLMARLRLASDVKDVPDKQLQKNSAVPN